MVSKKIPVKTCPRCKVTKIVHDFGSNRYAADKLTTNCKTCIKATKKKTEYEILCTKTLKAVFR